MQTQHRLKKKERKITELMNNLQFVMIMMMKLFFNLLLRVFSRRIQWQPVEKYRFPSEKYFY